MAELKSDAAAAGIVITPNEDNIQLDWWYMIESIDDDTISAVVRFDYQTQGYVAEEDSE